MDAEFRVHGPFHRFSRHHTKGVEEAGLRFGPLGRKAAIIHIMKDCGHIPTGRMWLEASVDSLGMIPSKPFNGFWDPQDFDRAVRKLIDHES
jgi:hypothetical protein